MRRNRRARGASNSVLLILGVNESPSQHLNHYPEPQNGTSKGGLTTKDCCPCARYGYLLTNSPMRLEAYQV